MRLDEREIERAQECAAIMAAAPLPDPPITVVLVEDPATPEETLLHDASMMFMALRDHIDSLDLTRQARVIENRIDDFLYHGGRA